MSRIHVCLVSEQTIPNILGIYHFKPDRVIFCTTEKMELQKKTDAIIDTLKLYGLDYEAPNRHERIEVDQDCLDDCEMKLLKIAGRHKDDEIIVNLTGGTKIMVLGAYNAFKDKAKQMIYTPIPKNEFITVHPKDNECKSPVPYNLKLSVEAYVTAYNVKIKNHKKIEQLKSNAISNKDLCRWMVLNYRTIEDLLFEFYRQLNKHRDDRDFRLKIDYPPRSNEEKELLNRFGIKTSKIEKTFLKNEIRFLTGDWLSEYCYNEIEALPVDDCVTGIELVSPKGAENELDVMFTKNNALYIIECKTLQSKEEKYQDFLYKISAIQQDFGLRVTGFMISTTRDILDNKNKNEIRANVLNRARHCKSKVIHPDDISNVGNFIRENLKL